MAKRDFSNMQTVELGRVDYGQNGVVVVRLLDLPGGPQIDVRLFFERGGKTLPSAKGIRLSPDRARELRRLLMMAATRAERGAPGPDAGDEPTHEGGSEA